MRFFILIILLFISFGSFAQSGKTPRPEPNVKKGVDRMSDALNLSAEQAIAMQKLEDSCANRLKALEALNPAAETRGKRVAALLANRETAIKQILTKEQYDKYVEMKEAAIRNAAEQRKKYMAQHHFRS